MLHNTISRLHYIIFTGGKNNVNNLVHFTIHSSVPFQLTESWNMFLILYFFLCEERIFSITCQLSELCFSHKDWQMLMMIKGIMSVVALGQGNNQGISIGYGPAGLQLSDHFSMPFTHFFRYLSFFLRSFKIEHKALTMHDPQLWDMFGIKVHNDRNGDW